MKSKTKGGLSKRIRSEVYNRIVFAKVLHQAGEDDCTNQSNQIAFTKGILLLHDAAEAALGAIADHLHAKLTGNLYLLNYYDIIEKADSKHRTVPYKIQMRNLNTIRNNAKHQGILPDPKSNAHFPSTVYALISDICQTYLGLDFSDVSMLNLIEDTLLKRLLQLSYRRMKMKDYGFCVTLAKLAYEYAAHCVSTSKHVSFIDSDLLAIARDHPEQKEMSELIKHINHDITEIKKQIAMLTTGINFADFKRFSQITPIIYFMAAGNVSCYYKDTNSEPDAYWVYNFVVNTIITWQSLGLAPVVPKWSTYYCQEFLKKNENTAQKEIVFDIT